jgi:hypothetical protein
MRVENKTNQAKYKLEPTAAMVMWWARSLYGKGVAQRYLESLDLEAARKIMRRCDEICPWYGEIIINRKHLIKYLAQRELRVSSSPRRVIIPGAGKSPLSLELLTEGGKANLHGAVEVDTRGLAAKEKIIRKIAPELAQKIKFIPGDISCRAAVKVYRDASDVPSMIILEGLSYYISVKKLKKLIRIFRTPERKNFLIWEYLLPYADVTPERRHIPRGMLGIARRIGGLRALTHYTAPKARKIIRLLGGKPGRRYTTKDMERLRLGKNHYFKKANEGWIECLTARI